MKYLIRAALLSSVIFVCMDSAIAQSQTQTAGGAQKFLASMIGRMPVGVQFRDGQGNQVPMRGTETTTHLLEKSYNLPVAGETTKPVSRAPQWPMTALKLDAVDSDGHASACTTRIAEFDKDPREQLEYQSKIMLNTGRAHSILGRWLNKPDDVYAQEWDVVTKLEDPRVTFAPPHYIDWGRAKIERSEDRISIKSPGPEFEIWLDFFPADEDLKDRIEYASKFLQMSCDAAADSGF